jgi:hypothetical protein
MEKSMIAVCGADFFTSEIIISSAALRSVGVYEISSNE